MFLNVPNKISKKDIISYGNIYKGESYKYILSDVANKKNKLILTSVGFYSYIYKILDTYLFIIGNQKGNIDIKPKKVDFLSKILKFEYLEKCNSKQIIKFDVPNQVFTITAHERSINGSFSNETIKMIETIIDKQKIHLQAYENPYERYMRFLCDNENCIGVYKHGLSYDLLNQNYIKVLKDSDISGFIIKVDNREFIT